RVIDQPVLLEQRRYVAGAAAAQVARFARQRGLGEVIEIGSESAADQLNRFRFGGVDPSQSQQQTDFATVGGPVMVVDARSGTLIYYGTPAQHEQLQSLIT